MPDKVIYVFVGHLVLIYPPQVICPHRALIRSDNAQTIQPKIFEELRMIESENTRQDQMISAFLNAKRLYHEGQIDWVKIPVADLPEPTAKYVNSMLLEAGIKFEVAKTEECFTNSIFLKIDDPLLGFLHHDPESASHLWADKNFEPGIRNNAIVDYLTAKKLEIGIYDRCNQARKIENQSHAIYLRKYYRLLNQTKCRRYWELRSYDSPKRILFKGKLNFLMNVFVQNEDFILGHTHFIMPAGNEICQHLK